jgi:hypothetical protein
MHQDLEVSYTDEEPGSGELLAFEPFLGADFDSFSSLWSFATPVSAHYFATQSTVPTAKILQSRVVTELGTDQSTDGLLCSASSLSLELSSERESLSLLPVDGGATHGYVTYCCFSE